MAVAASSTGSIAQPISAGVLAAVVGFASAFTIVLQGQVTVDRPQSGRESCLYWSITGR